MNLMREGGVGERVGALTVVAGALADVFIGMAIAYRPTSRLGLHAAVVISLTSGTILISGAVDRTIGANAENLAHHRASSRCPGDSRRSVMIYFALEFVHVIGAAVPLGTGAGIAFFMLMAHFRRDTKAVAEVARIVVIADFLFTATAVIVQPITGVLLAHTVGYSLLDGWIAWSIILYMITGAFWLPVMWMQMRMRDLAAQAVRDGSALPRSYGFPLLAHDRATALGILWRRLKRKLSRSFSRSSPRRVIRRLSEANAEATQ